jgi:hypothetical protein
MKGVVFTEYMEFIEEQFGFDVVDDMIEQAGVNGVYTQAGNYPFEELYAMVVSLSKIVDTPASALIEAFGKNIFKRLIVIYPKPIESYSTAFEFIAHIDNVVHPEVKKLYPETELPTFHIESIDETKLVTTYSSTKPLMDLAKGLMEGCAEHYGENIEVSYEVKPKKGELFIATFTMEKK